jgi:hypothetical protein
LSTVAAYQFVHSSAQLQMGMVKTPGMVMSAALSPLKKTVSSTVLGVPPFLPPLLSRVFQALRVFQFGSVCHGADWGCAWESEKRARLRKSEEQLETGLDRAGKGKKNERKKKTKGNWEGPKLTQ